MAQISSKSSTLSPAISSVDEDDEESYWDYEDDSDCDHDIEDDEEEEEVTKKKPEQRTVSFFDSNTHKNLKHEEDDEDDEDEEDEEDDSFDLEDEECFNDEDMIYADEHDEDPKTIEGYISPRKSDLLPLNSLPTQLLALHSPRTSSPRSPRYSSPRSPNLKGSMLGGRIPLLESMSEVVRTYPSDEKETAEEEEIKGDVKAEESTQTRREEEVGTVENGVIKKKKTQKKKKKRLSGSGGTLSHKPHSSRTSIPKFAPGRWDSLPNLQPCPLTPRVEGKERGNSKEGEEGKSGQLSASDQTFPSSLSSWLDGVSTAVPTAHHHSLIYPGPVTSPIVETGVSTDPIKRAPHTHRERDSSLANSEELPTTSSTNTISATFTTSTSFKETKRLSSIPSAYFSLFKRKESDPPPRKKHRVFGAPLRVVVKNQPQKHDISADVPNIVYEATTFLSLFAETEGLFRVSGTASKVEEFISAYNNGEAVEFKFEEKDDIHVVATLLKRFFNDLPTPLFTYRLYSRFIHAQSHKGPDEEVHRRCLEKLINQLPSPNRRTLHQLLKLLTEVAAQQETNKMTPNNLAICIGQELVRRQKIKDPQTALLEVKIVQALVADVIALFPFMDPAVFVHSRRLSSRSYTFSNSPNPIHSTMNLIASRENCK